MARPARKPLPEDAPDLPALAAPGPTLDPLISALARAVSRQGRAPAPDADRAG